MHGCGQARWHSVAARQRCEHLASGAQGAGVYSEPSDDSRCGSRLTWRPSACTASSNLLAAPAKSPARYSRHPAFASAAPSPGGARSTSCCAPGAVAGAASMCVGPRAHDCGSGPARKQAGERLPAQRPTCTHPGTRWPLTCRIPLLNRDRRAQRVCVPRARLASHVRQRLRRVCKQPCLLGRSGREGVQESCAATRRLGRSCPQCGAGQPHTAPPPPRRQPGSASHTRSLPPAWRRTLYSAWA